MSSTEAPETTADHAGAQPHAHGHPTAREYVQIFVILFVITALEITASYVAMPTWLFISALTGMAVAKFALVVGFYMHVKFDNPMFRRLFVFGLILALSVFAIVLVLFLVIAPDYAAAAN